MRGFEHLFIVAVIIAIAGVFSKLFPEYIVFGVVSICHSSDNILKFQARFTEFIIKSRTCEKFFSPGNQIKVKAGR